MKKILYAFLLLFCFSAFTKAQSISVEASIDSLEILIGEQTKINLKVFAGSKQNILFPQYPDTLIRGVEVLEVSKADTLFHNNKEMMEVKQEYVITSFDSALYYIPPFEVFIDSVKYESNALALKVYSMPVDTLNMDQFFGQKEIMKTPFVWSDWYLFILCFLFLAPVIYLIYYLIMRLRDNEPIIRWVKVEPKLPAHETALKEIEEIKNEKIWRQEGRAKEYYTELTDAIRRYINDRFEINATEMITSEIIEQLQGIEDKEALKDLNELLQTADLVKFAKHDPLMNEKDASLINAIDFINETKKELTEEEKAAPTEIKVIEKRSLRTKIFIGVGIVAFSATLIGLLIYIVKQLLLIIA